MTHEEVQRQLDAYALGALDDVSARRIEAHLASNCSECSDELYPWSQTANMLTYSVDPIAPSPSVKANLLSRIRSEKQTPQTSTTPTRPTLSSIKVDWRGWAVAATLLIAFGVVFVHSMGQSKQITEIEATSLKNRAQMERQAAALAVLEAKDATITPLTPATNDVTASAKVIWSASQKRWTLVTEHMASAPANKSYQLWFIVNDKKISGGVFNSPEEIAQQILPQDITHADVIAITLEKSGGSPQPEGPILLVGKTS